MDKRKSSRSSSSRNALSNYIVGKTLGVGGFGKVKLATHILTGLKVAVKILDRQLINDSAAAKVKREINIMRLLVHPHIVRLYEIKETESHIYVVMEYMKCGELFDYITQKGRIHEDEARHFFQQIISGVEHCHRCKIVHRDLKPENLLLDAKLNVKIADFGLGNTMCDGHFLKTSCGTPNYAAPEVISERLYAGPEVDVWSCGVILYAILCGRLPFDDDNFPALYRRIKNGNYPVPGHLSSGANDLIAKILVTDPVSRISIPEIRQHSWFKVQLPNYISLKPYATASEISEIEKTKVDENVLKEMAKNGFDIRVVIESLYNNAQNEATVSYYMLLHSRCKPDMRHQSNDLIQPSADDYTDNHEVYLRPCSSGEGNWALGFKSQSTPHNTMLEVLRTFHSLNVQWKRIGPFNMKCIWLSPACAYSGARLNGCVSGTQPGPNQICSSSTAAGISLRFRDTVKFEIQLYRASGELYVLDIQRLSGPPFLFLEICSAFLALST
nr:SNF1-related protein kinase catalytic subunit alpha KIN11-like [Ipomoea trifida]